MWHILEQSVHPMRLSYCVHHMNETLSLIYFSCQVDEASDQVNLGVCRPRTMVAIEAGSPCAKVGHTSEKMPRRGRGRR